MGYPLYLSHITQLPGSNFYDIYFRVGRKDDERSLQSQVTRLMDRLEVCVQSEGHDDRKIYRQLMRKEGREYATVRMSLPGHHAGHPCEIYDLTKAEAKKMEGDTFPKDLQSLKALLINKELRVMLKISGLKVYKNINVNAYVGRIQICAEHKTHGNSSIKKSGRISAPVSRM
jgi:hypothetical protein